MSESNQFSGYFDYNATTPVSETVAEVMTASIPKFYNASSASSAAQASKSLLIKSRQNMAQLLGCDPEQVAFTSGGSEANNWVLKSYLQPYISDSVHVITTAIEHPSILDTLKYLSETFGVEVSYLTPNADGVVTTDVVLAAIKSNTKLISVMFANNETGVIQPIGDIAKLARSRNIAFHVDGVQIIGKRVVDVRSLDVDFMSFSAHKFYGPKGIGGLYVRDPKCLTPLIHGGGQEMGLRAGTENIIAIAGLSQAAEDCSKHIAQWDEHYKTCKTRLINNLNNAGIQFVINGTTNEELAVANTLNISLQGVRGEALAAFLDKKYGIYVSVGSACSNNKVKKLSHVLKAMGLSDERIQGAIRISFGRYTSLEDIDHFTDCLMACTHKLLEFGQIA